MNEILNTRGYVYKNSTSNAIAAGSAVVNGKLFGVSVDAIQVNAEGWIKCDGTFELPAATTATASVGAVAYWSSSAKNVTATVGTNLPIGYFVQAKTNGETKAKVMLGAGLQPAS